MDILLEMVCGTVLSHLLLAKQHSIKIWSLFMFPFSSLSLSFYFSTSRPNKSLTEFKEKCVAIYHHLKLCCNAMNYGIIQANEYEMNIPTSRLVISVICSANKFVSIGLSQKQATKTFQLI